MKEIAHVLYGSQNYGLDTPESDKDYKVLLCPEFNDFYNYHKVEKSDLPAEYDPEHYSPMSIIRFHKLLMDGNPNCIEMLFSTEWNTNGNTAFEEYIEDARALYSDGKYLTLVWDRFYSALKGMALNTIKRDGINEKSVSRAYYLYKFMMCLKHNEFKIDFDVWRGNSVFHKRARQIRYGKNSQQELENIAESVKRGFDKEKETMINAANERRHGCYTDAISAIYVIPYLDAIIEDIVKRSILEELNCVE